MSGIFNPDIFNNDIFNVGIGIAASSAGIGLSPRIVDFVYSAGWHPRIPQIRIARPMTNVKLHPQRVVIHDNSDMKEMMDLYSRWRAAA